MPSKDSSLGLPLFLRSMRDALMLFIICILCIIPALIIGSSEDSQCIPTDGNKQCSSHLNDGKPTLRMIRDEELAKYTGATEGSRIWISILGEVYDVTGGEEYYGQDNSYHVFAGRDATPCFVTGVFTEEGSKNDINKVPAKDLVAIEEWKTFYDDHETYFKVGVLEGAYYDSEGNPTPILRNTWRRTEIGKMEQRKIQAERAAKRKKKLEERKAKKKLKRQNSI